MIGIRCSRRSALAVAAAITALACPGPASADPADPAPAPETTVPVPPPPAERSVMTPNQPAVPAADPAAVPPAPITPVHPPEIQNQSYGSGNNGGGIFGTLKDLWDQVKNPGMTEELMGGGGIATPPPGAGPAPALPPGYVSTNSPGSETPSVNGGRGSATGRPALPPGYYSTDGPPPPGYAYDTAPGALPAAPVTTIPATPGS